MLRRDFVRMAGAAGVALTAGIGFGRPEIGRAHV